MDDLTDDLEQVRYDEVIRLRHENQRLRDENERLRESIQRTPDRSSHPSQDPPKPDVGTFKYP